MAGSSGLRSPPSRQQRRTEGRGGLSRGLPTGGWVQGPSSEPTPPLPGSEASCAPGFTQRRTNNPQGELPARPRGSRRRAGPPVPGQNLHPARPGPARVPLTGPQGLWGPGLGRSGPWESRASPETKRADLRLGAGLRGAGVGGRLGPAPG